MWKVLFSPTKIYRKTVEQTYGGRKIKMFSIFKNIYI